MKKAFYLVLWLLTISFSTLISQNHQWEFGSFIGTSIYSGDLISDKMYDFNEANFGFGMFIRKNIHPNIGFRLNVFSGQLSGDDANYISRAERGFYFNTSVLETSLQLELDILGHKRYQSVKSFKKVISPVLFGGIGFAFLDPTIEYNESQNEPIISKINLDKNAGVANSRMTIPFGIGVKMDLSEKVTLGAEWGIRTVLSDLLDGISQAGNPNNDDLYTFGGFSVSYRFGEPDKDRDGVVDSKDRCPDLKGSKAINGCPDIDQDGITDTVDECPYEKGYASLNGCPDRDKDGVADKDDNCPNEAGSPALKGCPIQDSDGDGVEDSKDACPNEIGLPERQGCPFSDKDKDGLEDLLDECPDEAGFVFNNGCPDTDNDNVPDKIDLCPTIPGRIENDGCPELTEREADILRSAAHTVLFENDQAKILPESYVVLDQIVEILVKYNNYKIKIEGYTDNQGNDVVNQQLSESRARACYDYLISKGITASRMTYKGYGENNPIASNDTLRGRALNRRVEFNLTRE